MTERTLGVENGNTRLAVEAEVKTAGFIPQRRVELRCLWPEEHHRGAPGQGAGVPLFKEAHYLKLDCTKAFSLLDWRSVMDLEEALLLTARWYHAYYRDKDSDMLSLTRGQISTYIGKATAKGAVWTRRG
ncbi:MAG: hypothetical protein P1S59_12715 [bacterium]|nr:hypothetical protein [bacterium]